MNKVLITGNLTRDPELKTAGQSEKVTFTVAVRRNYKNADGNYDSDFINCEAWRNTATFISQYFSKGSGIELEGTIVTGSYEKDGKKYYTTVVRAEQVAFGKGKQDNKQDNKDDELDDYAPVIDPDLPF